MRSKCQKAFPH